MNASLFEQQLAQTQGVLIRTHLQPVRLLDDGQGHVTGVEFERTLSTEDGLQGTGETLQIPCDRVLCAIGQLFDDASGVESLQREGARLKVDAQFRTSHPKVWAGGDCIAGGEDLTVAAVEHGKQAAESIHRSMSNA